MEMRFKKKQSVYRDFCSLNNNNNKNTRVNKFHKNNMRVCGILCVGVTQSVSHIYEFKWEKYEEYSAAPC